MPAITSEQRLVDSTTRTVIKLTGYGVAPADTANASNALVVDVSTLAFALNANGYIMSSNTHPLSYYGVTVKRVWGNFSGPGLLKLQWRSNSNTDILVIGQGNFDFPQDAAGAGVVITNPNSTSDANNTGDILLSNPGFAANSAYTIFLDLKKDNKYYSAGQHADPTAFNR